MTSFGSALLLLLFFFLSFSNAQLPPPTSRPTSIVFATERDPLTLQYMININQGTPLAALKLVIDLAGKLPSLDCTNQGYTSSSYRPVKCTSPKCALADNRITCVLCNGTGPREAWCHKIACSIHTSNPVTRAVGHGELFTDVVAVKHNEGFTDVPDVPDPIVIPRRFAFGCATTSGFSQGLAKGARGVAGLGRSSGLSLVSQFSAGFRFPRIFALDFASSGGKMFFGGGPYVYSHGSFFGDLRQGELSYTKLLINPKSSEEYFIDLTSILIYDEKVAITNKGLLSIDKKTGVGGTKVDFQTPYTVLQTSIYKAVAKVHIKWAKSRNGTVVAPVAPFSTCYNASTIDLPDWVLQGSRLPPSITFMFPKNGLSTISDLEWMGGDVICLAFIDGGSKPKTSIVIGQKNLNGFLEFDISRSRFGFLQPVFP